jgi:cysteinyl-tRNA synthetase
MPDHVPRVTDYMPEIVAFIEALVANGAAYAANGDVYFRVGKDERYGSLSRQRVAEVEDRQPNPAKEDPHDFALWKATVEGEDTAWDSPWGKGRPGWHIECSVMAEALLGEDFELHGGGLDLVFPHHENELAQSRALGHRFARVWAHNGMLRFTGSKMSKSEGNTATLREVLDQWGPEVILVFLLTGHWRKPVDFSEESMRAAAARAQTLRNAFTLPAAPHDGARWVELADALDDDFDTPRALAVLHRWASDGQLELLRRGLELFGLGSLASREQAPPELLALAERRQAARAARDFGVADRLREEIEAAGWEVRDDPEGVTLVPRR